jgi:hypothetical protein
MEESDDRPAFARGFPRTPELDAVVAAFAAGNYARVRSEASRLASASSDEAVKSSLRVLVQRTEPDPLAKVLVFLTALLLVVLSGFWIVRSGGEHTSSPLPPPIIERIR